MATPETIATITIAIIALGISLVSAVFTIKQNQWIERRDKNSMYLELQRICENLLTLSIERDYLNKLYNAEEPSDLPKPNTPLEKMTEEQRAIYSFAGLQLNYFERIVIFQENEYLPKETADAWDTWLRDCVQAPYFMWAWKSLSGHYHPKLALKIDEISKELNASKRS